MSDPTYSLITSRTEFHDALRSAFRELASSNARSVILSDLDFAGWPLNDSGVIDDITRWAASHRQLTLLATHFDEVQRRHARWVTWRQNWSHIVACQAADEADAADVLTQFFIPGHLVVRLVDRLSFRGSVSRAEADLAQAQEGIDAILQRSQASFPATTLGL